MGEQPNEIRSGASDDAATVGGAGFGGSLPSSIEPKARAAALLHAYQESIRLSRHLAYLVVSYDFYAQITGKPYAVHDWLIGLILSPFGGAVYEFITGKIMSWRQARSAQRPQS